MKGLNKICAAFAVIASSAASATTLNPIQLLNPAGSSAGQAIVSTGPSTAPGWSSIVSSVIAGSGIAVSAASGSYTVSLATIAANRVMGNATGTVGVPTALTMPSCSTSASALLWTVGSGFSCNAGINAATLNGTTFAAPGPIGSTTPSTGAFTTLSASSTVSGAGFTSLFSSPSAIGNVAPSSGAFTTLSASSTVSGAGFTALFSSPSAIGNTAPSSGAFTTLSATSTVSGAGFTSLFASPPSIGSTTPASGSFTTLNASSTVGGSGFSNYLATPPAIGSSTPNSGAFTTLSASSGITGVVNGSAAAAGKVGEIISAVLASGSAISATSATPLNVTSISLTAGDWVVWGTICDNVGATTVHQVFISSVSSTSGTSGNPTGGAFNQALPGSSAGIPICQPTGLTNVNVSSTTTYYLVAQVNFTVSTAAVYGAIYARRVR